MKEIFIKNYIDVIRYKYMVFNGRATRTEFWWFMLFDIIISLLLWAFSYVTGFYNEETGWGLFEAIYTLATFLPSTTVIVRRLQDTGRTMTMAILFAILNFIVTFDLLSYFDISQKAYDRALIYWGLVCLYIIIVCCFDSQKGENQYGKNPKEEIDNPAMTKQ